MRRTFYIWPHRKEDTCRVHVKKYYDVEQQKYIRDKLEKLNTCTLAEIAETDHYVHDNYWRYPVYTEQKYNFPKFVPKDNDWVDEPIQPKVTPKAQEVRDQIKITRPTDEVSVGWLQSMLRK